MAILSATSSQNDRTGSGRYIPLRRKKQDDEENNNQQQQQQSNSNPMRQTDLSEKFFDVSGDLKDTLDALDRANIRVMFKQTSDPVYLAFNHIDRKPIKTLAKEFVKSSVDDMYSFVMGLFTSDL